MAGNAISRVTDLGVGICCCHPPIPCIGVTGVLITGAGTVSVEGQSDSRIGDLILGSCGHIGVMVTGSPTVTVENSPTARIGDIFSGCFSGVIITGAGSGDCG
jgi:uncharacterized Zn-binding protein involved in type VI secretion